ncbi:MAG: hypothetical protein ACR2IF_19270 [Terriglobales bacterium]
MNEVGNVVTTVIIGGGIFVVAGALFLRAAREDSVVGRFVPYVLGLKIAGAATYILVMRYTYHSLHDVSSYFDDGLRFSQIITVTGQVPMPSQLYGAAYSSTYLITAINGLLFSVVGPSLSVIVLLFASIGLLGQYFYVRAFRIAFPDADPTMACVLLFAYPSILYWTSALGKDALSLCALGMIICGFAKVIRQNGMAGWMLIAGGVALQYVVRPYVAPVVIIALLVSLLLSRNRLGFAGVMVRVLALPLVLFIGYHVLTTTQRAYDAETLAGGVNQLHELERGSHAGGSAYSSSIPERVLLAPFLLQRPFPWEVHNPAAGIACLEGLLTAFLAWKYRRGVMRAFLGARSDPFLGFCVVLAIGMLVTLSLPFSNFGTLARERTMALPIVLLLVCVPFQQWRPSSEIVGAARPIRRMAAWSSR